MSSTTCNQAMIQQYIDEGREESHTLEYKAAGALDRTDARKRDITKDVSAMANAAGGLIVYGVKEYDAQPHLPEKLDPINRGAFSKEWLEHVINNIRPRIQDILIHPVELHSGPDHVAYVVEIPQSTTAHQAMDFRYYRRYNFEALPMHDQEVRDVMNRAVRPDEVEFGYQVIEREQTERKYHLIVVVKNQGPQLIHHYKLEFAFPKLQSFSEGRSRRPFSLLPQGFEVHDSGQVIKVTCRSHNVLFPGDKENLLVDNPLQYWVNHGLLRQREPKPIQWVLYADNMEPKRGEKPFHELHDLHTTLVS